MTRFSPVSGTRSAIVPRHAARSSDSRESETPGAAGDRLGDLQAMPDAASSFSGYAQPGCRGLTTIAPAGSSRGHQVVVGHDDVDAGRAGRRRRPRPP